MALIESIPGLAERTLAASPAAKIRYLYYKGQIRPVPTSLGGAIASPLTAPLVAPLARLGIAAGLSAAGLPALAAAAAPGAACAPSYPDLSVHAYVLRLLGATDGGATAAAALFDRLRDLPGLSSSSAIARGSPVLGSGGAHAAEVLLDAVMSGVYAGDVRQLSARSVVGALWQLEAQHGGLPAALGAKLRAALLDRVWTDRGGGAAAELGSASETPFVRECAASASVAFTGGMSTLIEALAGELLRCSAPGSGADAAAGTANSVRAADMFRSGDANPGAVFTEPQPMLAGEGGPGGGFIALNTAATALCHSGWRQPHSRDTGQSDGNRSGAASSCPPPRFEIHFSRQGVAGHALSAEGSRCGGVLFADHVICALPAPALARLLAPQASARHRAPPAAAASRIAAARAELAGTPCASVALVNLGYRGANHLAAPQPARAQRGPSMGAPEASGQRVGSGGKQASSPRAFTGFGYLIPFCERRTAAAGPAEAQAGAMSPSARCAATAAGAATPPVTAGQSSRGRYGGSVPAAAASGVLGMTWDSSVFPGQAQAHAEAVAAGRVPSRRCPATGAPLPGRAEDVAAEVAAGETRVTVMLGGAMHGDMFEEEGGTEGLQRQQTQRAAECGFGPLIAAEEARAAASDSSLLVYKALAAACAHVGLPANPDSVNVAVAWHAIPQYSLGHAARTASALRHLAAAFADPSPPGQVGSGSACHLQIIGNSFHGVGVADSIKEGLAAGQCAANALRAA